MTKSGLIYVTGAAGMIGSNVCHALVAAGHSVIGVDNLWRGTLANLGGLRSSPSFEFRHADIVSDRDWYRGMSSESVLIHTADIVGGIAYVFSHEWRVFQQNLLINTQVARVVQELQPRQVIYLGTACSYPQGLQRSVETSQLKESLKFPADPESGYGWSKLVGEIELGLAVKGSRTRLNVLDLHNVFGWPCVYKDNTAQVIPSLVKRALTAPDRKLVVWGDGTQGRAFIHVRDVVAGVLHTLTYEGSQRTLMLGPSTCTTIAELAQLIKAHPKVNLDTIEFDTSKPTGDIGRFADSSLAERELGWRISVPFREGLYELIDAIHADLHGA